MAAPVVGRRGRSGSAKLSVVYDAEGNPIQPEWRDDEEQDLKLQEIIDLLVAAGYFRARIKGLSPFDKIVGGITWCITTCNVELDVDLLFQENLTIGQKIALTEKLVRVLPTMACPHRLEPHQIQGLDCINIFPVVQWLVKRALETREELGDYIRAFSLSQFYKNYTTSEDEEKKQQQRAGQLTVQQVDKVYRPKRKFRRPAGSKPPKDEILRVQSTLLEYGDRSSFTTKGGEGDQGDEAEEEKRAATELESRLLSKMAAVSGGAGQRVTASAVGSIVSSEEILRAAADFDTKEKERLEEAEKQGAGGVQYHQRVMATLEKQVGDLQAKAQSAAQLKAERKAALKEIVQQINEIHSRDAEIDEELDKFAEIEASDDGAKLQKLKGLVAKNEAIKKEEQEFRAKCKTEKARLEAELAGLERLLGGEGGAEDAEREAAAQERRDTEFERHSKLRLQLAKKNRELAVVQRKLDDVPSTAELSQYQRRFVELYNQVAATHKETKQFFALYNTLDDTKLYLNKEITLLNSVYDNFADAMSSPEGKEQFLKQLENIVDGIKQNMAKVEKRKQQEKIARDSLQEKHLGLLEIQREYAKLVRDFQEECRKNEILLAKLNE